MHQVTTSCCCPVCARTFFVPYLQGLAAYAVEDGQEAGLKGVLEHGATAPPPPVCAGLCWSSGLTARGNKRKKQPPEGVLLVLCCYTAEDGKSKLLLCWDRLLSPGIVCSSAHNYWSKTRVPVRYALEEFAQRKEKTHVRSKPRGHSSLLHASITVFPYVLAHTVSCCSLATLVFTFAPTCPRPANSRKQAGRVGKPGRDVVCADGSFRAVLLPGSTAELTAEEQQLPPFGYWPQQAAAWVLGLQLGLMQCLQASSCLRC